MDSATWDARYAEAGLVWSERPNQFVEEVFAPLPAGAALDLATGEGRNALWLAARGWQVTAVDFSPVGIDKARALAQTHGVTVDWVVADLRDHVPAAGAYPAVLVAYLHLPPAVRAGILARAAEALAVGGTLLVIGHDVTNLRDGVGGPQDPTILYSPEAIAAELAGLRIVRAERVTRPVAGDGQHAIDTVVVAVRE